jgi:hypothetical protein
MLLLYKTQYYIHTICLVFMCLAWVSTVYGPQYCMGDYCVRTAILHGRVLCTNCNIALASTVYEPQYCMGDYCVRTAILHGRVLCTNRNIARASIYINWFQMLDAEICDWYSSIESPTRCAWLFLCILYHTILAVHVSGAICTHHQEYKQLYVRVIVMVCWKLESPVAHPPSNTP